MYQSLFFNKVAGLRSEETLAQVFSFLIEHLWAAAFARGETCVHFKMFILIRGITRIVYFQADVDTTSF